MLAREGHCRDIDRRCVRRRLTDHPGENFAPGRTISALATEPPGLASRGLEPGFDRADLARGIGVVGLVIEDLLEVAEGLPVAAEHALDAAEVEPRALGLVRLVGHALERL